MGTAEVIKYLDDNQFGKKSYRELSAKSNKSVSLLLSDKTEAYDFDDITKYIFPKYTPSSADAILIKTNKIILIEFKGGFERKISEDNFDREKCRCEKINDVCEDYASLLKKDLKNIKKELTSNLLKKAAESRWTLEYHLLPEVYKDNLYLDFHVNYNIVMDKVKENPVDAMEQIMDEWANIHRKDNFYEQMDKSVKYLYCESRFKKKSFYDKVEVCSVQEFEQMISLFL